MSSETIPISGPRFAEALKDLSLASLHLKTLELRNSLAHLAYSNAQLRPFAEGTEVALDGTRGQPDPDCVEAIRENEVVIRRMRERIELVRAEVEGRGVSWREFETTEEVEDTEPGVVAAAAAPAVGGEGSVSSLPNGVNNNNSNNHVGSADTERRSNPWTDGTFQVGVIRNGVIHMDTPVPGPTGSAVAPTTTTTTTAPAPAETTTSVGSGSGGSLTDEQLRRLLEERLAEDGGDAEDEDGGLHL